MGRIKGMTMPTSKPQTSAGVVPENIFVTPPIPRLAPPVMPMGLSSPSQWVYPTSRVSVRLRCTALSAMVTLAAISLNPSSSGCVIADPGVP